MRRFGLAVLVLASAAGLVVALAAGGCSKDKGTNPVTTTTTEAFDSGTLVSGTPFTHTFNTAGSFDYRCRFHSTAGVPGGMRGTVMVDDNATSTTASVSVGGVSNVFTPSSVTIKTTGTVTWTLASGAHTVTRP